MDDKRELNDILIGGDEVYRGNKSKNIVLIFAFIVVLVLVAIVAMLVITNSKKDEPVVAAIESEPALNLDSFKQIPEEEDRFEKIVQELKAKQQKEPQERQEKERAKIELDNSRGNTVVKMPPKTKTTTKTTTGDIKKDSTKEITKSIPKAKEIRIPSASLAKDPRLNNGDLAETGYYLQVGSFNKEPAKDFISKLDKYSYRVQEIIINSKVFTRYLIGPYQSREEAERNFNNVKEDITTPVYLQVN